ncbi:MAG TPA: AAA family ATPase [Caldilineaceae bacterium]|nr:AAA family ATPase [Caldilineaceae bacterium]
MRVPYIVGRWVRGENHYGRERLIDHLLHTPDSAIWLVGTRRMGKTSLLRQLELLTGGAESRHVPIFWDLQGCESSQGLSDELFFSLEDAADRFAQHKIDVSTFAGQDALLILRSLARTLSEQDKQLLVLIDEAEVLIDLARLEPAWVARLRRTLQDGRLRTIITATKLLAQLHYVSSRWMTSPFLFGFSLVNLGKLDDSAARALVRQLQADRPVRATDGVVDDILIHTNGQPYLVQYLCQRLFQTDSAGNGYLRPVEDADLAADHILAGFFRIDFEHLTRIERRLLLTVADLTIARESELLALLSDLSPHRIRMFLYGLGRLGYLRQIFGQWAVGNEFLRRWVVDHYDELMGQLDSALDDQLQEALLEVGHSAEVRYLREEISRLEAELAQVEAALGQATGAERDALLAQLDRLRAELARLRNDLDSIAPDSGS